MPQGFDALPSFAKRAILALRKRAAARVAMAMVIATLAGGPVAALETPLDGIWCGPTSDGGGVYFVVAEGGTRVTQGSVGIGRATLGFEAQISGRAFDQTSLFDSGHCRYFSSVTGGFGSTTTASGAGSWSVTGGATCPFGFGSEGWSATWVSPFPSGVSADLAAEMAPSMGPPVAGAVVDLPFTVRNLGPASVACMRLALASSTGAVTASLGSGSFLRAGGIWAGPPLAPGGSLAGVVRVRPPSDAVGDLTVSAGAYPVEGDDPALANNDATLRATLTAQADLEATLTGPTYFTTPATLSYEIDLTPKGPSMARNVRVDLLTDPPLTTTGVWVGSEPLLISCAKPCVLGDLQDSRRLRFDFAPPPGLVPPRSFLFTVSAVSDTPDPVPGNDRPSLTTTLLGEARASSFYTVTPCRLLDTRLTSPDSPSLCSALEVDVVGSSCGIPSTAVAVSLNVAVTEPRGVGHITVFPAGFPLPLASNINFGANQTRANNVIVRQPPTGRIALRVNAPSTPCTHAIVDVNGYFE